MITEPGVYQLSPAEYHGEPCDGPSLSSTGARQIVSDCPAAFRGAVQEPREEFDIGNATHLLVLEPENFETSIGRVPFDDYRKAEAKAARDEFRAAGRIPLLRTQVAQVKAMRDAIFADPVARLAFQSGAAEQSLIWRDPEFGFWCKSRPDWLPAGRRYLVDVKTSMSAKPDAFAKAVVNFGYHQQADWYMEGVRNVLGDDPQRFAFIVVSKTVPHLVSTCWLDEEAIQWGKVLNRYARGVFAWCLDRNEWPSYRPVLSGQPAAFTVSLPGWARADLERRQEAGEFTPPQEIAA